MSKYLLIDRATTTKAVTKLLKSGLIEKIPDDKDKRAFNLYLTPKGEEACKTIKVEAADFLKEMIKDIPEEEYIKTINTLDQMLKNVKNMHTEIKKYK
ncbi:MarR family transcriptional regulator [Psychrilyobacter piezotolerans]|uniref:MarR family transcriptional regulator n=1 Tax=Psychrilyobacter piezotolerans TaxID=2293438 RepID=A0ABX9KJ46_9FUSO|nr:winged helix DNA-binding protein [Psychrilyobacter piezotolerans]RDE64559.1 MarR family transcriptional regulator [Psychrilyobacter sp. S5]REI42371.1 MarR family transcriptional regulator [Psychrilyobacter piezotolerans]